VVNFSKEITPGGHLLHSGQHLVVTFSKRSHLVVIFSKGAPLVVIFSKRTPLEVIFSKRSHLVVIFYTAEHTWCSSSPRDHTWWSSSPQRTTPSGHLLQSRPHLVVTSRVTYAFYGVCRGYYRELFIYRHIEILYSGFWRIK
jgi:hypothetical protein